MKNRAALCVAIFGLALALGRPEARADAAIPVAVAAHLTDEGDSAKLIFDLSAPVEGRARPIADPNRVLVDIPEVEFQINPNGARLVSTREGAIVKALRFGLLAQGRSRIVIELARPACVARLETKPVARGADASKLTLELKACGKEAFASAVAAAQPAPTPSPSASAATAAPSGPPVIVLDPGHGGVDGGAYGVKGSVEKTIVFDYAQELKRQLEATGKYKVLMTRTTDAFVSLEDRVKFAQDANAALFVSIHADTLPGAGSSDVSGTTVYTCSDRASDSEAARIAERENAADKAAGADRKEDAAGVADILFDLKRRETRAYAHLFSRDVVAQWQAAGRLNHNPERSAGFMVLKAPDFPSVLVELGYLSNPQDVANLVSPDWRAKTAAAMTAAIAHFFAAGGATATEGAAQAAPGTPAR
jgi:N-acetylmuramoyl-L-alanine amidase